MSFAINLKKVRENAGLTQAALGEKMGLKSSVIGRYELGEATPKPDRLLDFAYALNTDVNTLVGYTPPPLKSLEETLKDFGIVVTHNGHKVALYYDSSDLKKCIDMPEDFFIEVLKYAETAHQARMDAINGFLKKNAADHFFLTFCNALDDSLTFAILNGNKENINLGQVNVFISFINNENDKRRAGAFAINAIAIGNNLSFNIQDSDHPLTDSFIKNSTATAPETPLSETEN